MKKPNKHITEQHRTMLGNLRIKSSGDVAAFLIECIGGDQQAKLTASDYAQRIASTGATFEKSVCRGYRAGIKYMRAHPKCHAAPLPKQTA